LQVLVSFQLCSQRRLVGPDIRCSVWELPEMASPDLADACDEFRFAPLARMGRSIRLLKKAKLIV
jgi:hypothetical protein